MKLIAQRELRNDVSAVLRRVEAGERLRVTVDGRPVADLVPIARPTYLPVADLLHILAVAPLDPGFSGDVDAALDQEIG